MRATLLTAVRQIDLANVDDPVLRLPTDVLVTVLASCICGSDLHPYRGTAPTAYPKPIGHEFVGVVSDVGADVRTLSVGDVVVAPFAISDGTCVHCHHGIPTSCIQGSFWGAPDRHGLLADGGQGEQVRVPLADGTLVRVERSVDDAMLPDLLALSDVMGTGHHAAVLAGVRPGSTVVVVGDGAVGLCGVLAARRLGAARIIVMSRHRTRQELATAFGATDIVAERGPDGIARVLDLLDGVGADCALECVGTQESLDQAMAVTRPGGTLGCVGAPFFQIPVGPLFGRNIGIRAGVAPVRAYLPDLLADVLAGEIHPGRVFDLELPLDDVAEGYRAMDERRAIKVLLRP
ncbi:MAG: putative Zn-containing alcohol dehydrogenase [Frankiales bacterium]|nr:putative Zn-containing alcohol dehydrogenase [Frankiales bacterium]